MLMKASGETELATLACYCEKHLPVSIDQCPIDYAPYLNATRKSNKPHMKPPLTELEVANPNSSFEFDDVSRSTKKACTYAETYKLGPSLVPVVVITGKLPFERSSILLILFVVIGA